MYKLFTKRFEANNSIIRPPSFELLRRTYQYQILNIISYFHDRVYAVKSNHILCRLITTAGAAISNDLDKYVDIINSRSPYVAKHFNFTSPITYGTVHSGNFYGSDSNEIIISDEDYFNPYQEIADWKNIKAITVLDHEVSDLGLMLPLGASSMGNGLAVIKVNIPLLLVQYRGFVQNEMSKRLDDSGNKLSVTHFVNMYVLPSMLYSHLELCIVNRLMNLYYGAPMGDPVKKYPFPLSDYSNKLDRVLEDILKHVKGNNIQYSMVLKNIPSVFNRDGQESLMMPDVAKTRQVWWALTLARLKHMKFLIDCGGDRGKASNGVYINRMKIEFRRMLDENVLRTVLNRDMYFDVSETMLELLKT